MSGLASHWLKRLAESAKPAYLMIPDLIEEDLASGRLQARDRLPALRDLAEALRLNYTTVARAYAEARKRGLIDAKAGSGTFVRGRAPALPLRAGTGAEMTMNMPPEPPVLTARLRESAGRLMGATDPFSLLRYQDFGGTPADRAVATEWLKRYVPACRADTVLICPGIHSALVALVSLLARPGQTICLDTLAYPGIKAIATQLGVQLQALPSDEEGPLGPAFETLCKTQKPSALYCNPTLQNPSTRTMPQGRREILADIALRYSVPIIEDDAYGMLPQRTPDAMATLAPELTYYVTGLSKCFGAGLRIAFINGPTARQTQRLAGTLRATTVMASPFNTLLATSWIKDGTAEDMLKAIRAESVARQLVAREVFAGRPYDADPEGFHLWLPVPQDSGWRPSELALHLRSRGIGAVSSAAFSTDGNPPDAIRLCLGGPVDRDEMEESLQIVADTLDDPHHLHSAML
ncbi:PLP-dependent aminotransferase family protein [Cupriavidus basilensis]|uniref:aminotransferase-like domain-containing protein n=1 Tax=Cupriavidus basilensis TaxID=68895 RepID=UPI0023E79D8F|nr:PLP-dependent aminotransferase family protein [Cupriavidus basilensis]MDF3886639.1 PLP-dependent aminotransferase family protein [Cupriavidus basilensis]